MLLTNTLVRRRLLVVMSSRSLLTVNEITKHYNNRYPPGRIGRLFGKGMTGRSILKHLEVLCETGLIRKELLPDADQMIDRRIANYTILPAGLQQLATRT